MVMLVKPDVPALKIGFRIIGLEIDCRVEIRESQLKFRAQAVSATAIHERDGIAGHQADCPGIVCLRQVRFPRTLMRCAAITDGIGKCRRSNDCPIVFSNRFRKFAALI